MRKETSRKAYTSDLTDAQWELIEPLIPTADTTGPHWRTQAHHRHA